jgi:hypothetical protein
MSAFDVVDGADRADAIATPLSATIDQLRGLPDALLITAEVDVFAAKLLSVIRPARLVNNIQIFMTINSAPIRR